MEHVVIEFHPEFQLVTRPGGHRQGVMRGFVTADLGDGEAIDAGQRSGVDWVVFVHEDGVEQPISSDDAVNFGERHMLVIEGVIVCALQLAEQICGGHCRGELRSDRHGIYE
nr:hypothetical protein CPGR_00538 [Mycolicibacterium malmesburyense]